MKKSELLKNDYINTILTKFFTITISLVQSVVIARYLGASLKGVNSYINSITSVGSIIVTFGMHQAYPYFRKKYGKEEILEDFISIMYVLYAIYFICAIAVSFAFSKIEIKAAVILIPLLGYSNVMGYVCLIEDPKERNKWWRIVSVIDVIYAICLYLFTQRNIFWGISLLAFADLVKCTIYTIALGVKPRYSKKQRPIVLALFKMGFFPMIAALMTTLNYKLDVFMLRSSPLISDAQVGVYSIGIQVANKIVLIPDTLKGVLSSKLAGGADEKEVSKICRLSFFATVGMCAAFMILGKPFISFMYGAEYTGAYEVMVISAIGALMIGYFKLIAQYNIVNHMQIRNVILLSISITINLILNLILIPRFGINGAAMATGVGHLICGIVFMIWFARHSKQELSVMIVPQKHDIEFVKTMMKKITGKK